MGSTWPFYKVLLAKKMKVFSILDLPELPKDLIDEIEESIVGSSMQKFPDQKIKQFDATEVDDAIYTRWLLTDRYTNYVKMLIPEIADSDFNIGFQSIKGSNNNICQLHPHTDGKIRGTFCISFLINDGGTNVETFWWQEHNKGLIRDPWSHAFDLNALRKIESTIFPIYRWNIIRTDLLHSVHNITKDRKAFTIGFFDERIFDTIVEKYGIC